MIFRETELAGCVIAEPEPSRDERGFFARLYDADEFRARKLELPGHQFSVSWNPKAFTLRGLHFQVAPHYEAKLVRCTRGRIFDVAVDLREGSPTLGCWTSAILDADNRLSLFIPKGFAHGFITLENGCEVHYSISTPYVPTAARGLRWDDPVLAIPWPVGGARLTISESDRTWPYLSELSQFLRVDQ